MTAERAWLVDASIYIFRAWFSLPDRWQTRDGVPLQAVYGYTKFLLDLIEGTMPRPASTQSVFHLAAAFDESLGSNYRNDIYPDYKSSRELPDEVLAFQLTTCREITQILGIPDYGGPRFEADDYLATLARLYREQGVAVTVVTRDKDLGQLLSNADDRWWDYAANTSLNGDQFFAKFGVLPSQFGDYLALVGDSIDDIPGVPGVGAKTAAALLQAFPTLDRLGEHLTEVAQLPLRGAKGVATRLQEHWPQVLMARQLTGLEDCIPELTHAPTYKPTAENFTELSRYLSALNLQGLLTRRAQAIASSFLKS